LGSWKVPIWKIGIYILHASRHVLPLAGHGHFPALRTGHPIKQDPNRQDVKGVKPNEHPF